MNVLSDTPSGLQGSPRSVRYGRQVECVHAAVLFGMAPERLRGLDRGNPGSVSCWFTCAMAALFPLLWSMGIAGCSPSGAAAEPPLVAAGTRAVQPRPAAGRSDTKPSSAASPMRSGKPANYVLAFEARANPFAPPKLEAGDRLTTAGATARVADVRLLGLMNDGGRSMAAVEVDGKQSIVFVGTRLGVTADAGGLRILQIRGSDIVVGQNGRQWIVPLPRP